jgi:hypothetical protein
MEYLNLLRYVKGKKIGRGTTAKIEYGLTEVGLVRALMEIEIDKYTISKVARYCPYHMRPIFSTWRSFEEAKLVNKHLGILRSIFNAKGMGTDLLEWFEPAEQEIRKTRKKIHPNEFGSLPGLVRALFLLELGYRTTALPLVSLLAKETEMFKAYVEVHEQVRLDQMFYAKLFNDREFQVVDMRRSLGLSTMRVLPRLPESFTNRFEDALNRESKRKRSQRYLCRTASDMLDQYVWLI